MKVIGSLLAVALLAVPAMGQPLVDGTLDVVDYGPALAVQTVQTQFGDNTDPTGFGDGGELDAGYATISGGRLYVMLAGNIQPNFNKVSVFIDSVAGGENVLSGALAYDFSDVSANFGGLTFDAGFEADYHLFGRWNGGAFELDIVDRANSTPGAELGNFGAATVGVGTGIQSGMIAAGGSATTGADAGTFLTQDVDFGFNNTNILGVVGGTAAPGPTEMPEAVLTGLEFSVSLADLGNPGPGDIIKIHAAYGNGDNNFHSNQILGGLPAPQGNLGGDGGGNFTGNLSGINFNQYGGDQFFTIAVPIPEPTSMVLFGLGLVGLGCTRRRS